LSSTSIAPLSESRDFEISREFGLSDKNYEQAKKSIERRMMLGKA